MSLASGNHNNKVAMGKTGVKHLIQKASNISSDNKIGCQVLLDQLIAPADPAWLHPAAMLLVATSFNQDLRVKVLDWDSGEEYDKVLKTPCVKPCRPVAPTLAQLRRLAPLELALKAVLAAQQEHFDAEWLNDSFKPFLKLVRDMQGIQPHEVDLL